jgi:hypothetical protein
MRLPRVWLTAEVAETLGTRTTSADEELWTTWWRGGVEVGTTRWGGDGGGVVATSGVG